MAFFQRLNQPKLHSSKTLLTFSTFSVQEKFYIKLVPKMQTLHNRLFHICLEGLADATACNVKTLGPWWCPEELAHDQEVLGLIPATSILFSGEPADLKFVQC